MSQEQVAIARVPLSLQLLHIVSQQASEYNGYNLDHLPVNARPDPARRHQGKHSYTVVKGAAKIEVLLNKCAYYVRGPNKGQITWSKFDGPHNAWITAGVVPSGCPCCSVDSKKFLDPHRCLVLVFRHRPRIEPICLMPVGLKGIAALKPMLPVEGFGGCKASLSRYTIEP